MILDHTNAIINNNRTSTTLLTISEMIERTCLRSNLTTQSDGTKCFQTMDSSFALKSDRITVKLLTQRCMANHC